MDAILDEFLPGNCNSYKVIFCHLYGDSDYMCTPLLSSSALRFRLFPPCTHPPTRCSRWKHKQSLLLLSSFRLLLFQSSLLFPPPLLLQRGRRRRRRRRCRFKTFGISHPHPPSRKGRSWGQPGNSLTLLSQASPSVTSQTMASGSIKLSRISQQNSPPSSIVLQPLPPPPYSC